MPSAALVPSDPTPTRTPTPWSSELSDAGTSEPLEPESGGNGERESPVVPERVGPYEVGKRIGRGGMGSVHEAVHVESGRQVALKLPKEGASARACARLLREARTARAAAGEHVVEVLDAGLDASGRPFVAMERLEGQDLGAILRREGRLEVEDAVALSTELLRGLLRVHAAGVVHRDLKPENLVVVSGLGTEGATEGPPRLKIVDFGVSKARTGGALVPGSLTRDGIVLGTPLYMSPEQAQGLPDVDERSDLWSAGAILFQCLAGRAPHAGATYEQIVVAVCATDAPDVRTCNPAVPGPIAAVVARALARDRRRRFQDARSMLDALSRAAAGEEGAANLDLATESLDAVPSSRAALTEPVPLLRRRRPPRRGPQLAVALASLAVGVATALGVIAALRAPETETAGSATEESRADEPEAPTQVASVRAAPPPVPVASMTEPVEPAAAKTAAPAGPSTPPRSTAAPVPRSAPARGVAAGLPLKAR